MNDLFAPKRRIERQYAKSIKRIFRTLLITLKNTQNPDGAIQTLREYANSAGFLSDAQNISLKMVTALFADGNRSWRQAASRGTRGREIHIALMNELMGHTGNVYRQMVQRNAFYISTLPLKLAEKATEMAAVAYNEGRRADEVTMEIIGKLGVMAYSRAALIARTEVSKASTELTKARAAEIGLGWYIWRTSKDERVRDSHQKMDGIIINWNDPPSPELLNGEISYGYYHAGEIFNCRCYPEPIVDLDSVSWPHNVYHSGNVVKMNRKEFERLGGV